MIDGHQSQAELEDEWVSIFESMKSNVQFDLEVNFRADLPLEEPKKGRHRDLVDQAMQSIWSEQLFVDCSTSMDRQTVGDGVVPCITPTHPIYSLALGRYLTTFDFLQAQGLWKSLFSESVYCELLQPGGCGQSIAGNAFSSTVCQAATIAGIAGAPGFFNTLRKQAQAHVGVLKRISRKRCAPEFSKPEEPVAKKAAKQTQRGKRKAQFYKRRQPGVDGRKESKGKKECVSIWQKEKV